ncbi:MAG: hypothetical protein OEU40_14995, partial [Gammaproteobacteria bacterium]|nr:hypothetical protein [Gammaproteobacteria bacterium]
GIDKAPLVVFLHIRNRQEKIPASYPWMPGSFAVLVRLAFACAALTDHQVRSYQLKPQPAKY